jgi:SulP family sulfate permease
MGICLLDWSAWRRLRKMARIDSAAFLVTAGAVVTVNAVLAVAIGCALYGIPYVYRKFAGQEVGGLTAPAIKT